MEKEKIIKIAKKNIQVETFIVDYLENGLSVKEIASKHNVNQSYVYRMLNNRGVNISRITSKTYDNIAKDYKDGMDAKELSQKYNLHIAGIYRALRLKNVKLRPKKRDLTEHQKTILDRITAGETQSSIAKEMGLSRQRVNQIYKEYVRSL